MNLRNMSVMVLVAAIGCGPAPFVQTQQVVMPESFEEDGATWTRQEWTEHQDRDLDAFFRRRMELVDNPGLQGEKVCYEGKGGRHRCYFVTAVGDSSRWILLEHRGKKFEPMVEGEGAPFDQLEPKE